jgi:WD40 repeat protein
VFHRMLAYHEPSSGLARLLTAAGEELTVWDGETGAILRRLRGPEAKNIHYMIGFSSTSPGGLMRQCVATGGGARMGVTVFDPDVGSGEVVLRLDLASEVTAMTSFEPAWAPGEACLVVALAEPSVDVWAVASGERLLRIDTLSGRVEGLAVYRTREDEDRIVGALVEGVSQSDTYVWDARSGVMVQHIRSNSDAVPLATFRVGDGSPRLVTCGPGSDVNVWNPEAGSLIASPSGELWGMVFEMLVFEEGGGEGGEEAATPPRRVVLAAGDNHGTTVVWTVGHAMVRPEGQVMRAANKRG